MPRRSPKRRKPRMPRGWTAEGKKGPSQVAADPRSPDGELPGLKEPELGWNSWEGFAGKTLFARSFSEPGSVDWEVALRDPGDSSHPEELPRVIIEFKTKSLMEHPDGTHTMTALVDTVKASAMAPWMKTTLLRRVQDFVAEITVGEGLGMPRKPRSLLNGFGSWR